MLERISKLAEQAATGVSRRQFLGRFGRGAMVVAAAAGGLLAIPQISVAGRKPPRLCNGAISSLSCQGLHVGDGCIDGDFTGVCVAAKKSDSCTCGSAKH
jgi:hypothetical protein